MADPTRLATNARSALHGMSMPFPNAVNIEKALTELERLQLVATLPMSEAVLEVLRYTANGRRCREVCECEPGKVDMECKARALLVQFNGRK